MKLSELNSDNIIELLEEAVKNGDTHTDLHYEEDISDFQILANNRDDDYPDPVSECPHIKDPEYPTEEEIEKILATIRKSAEDGKIHTLHIDGFHRAQDPNSDNEEDTMTVGHWGFDIEIDRPEKLVPDYTGAGWIHPLSNIEKLELGKSVCDMHDWDRFKICRHWDINPEYFTSIPVPVSTAEALIKGVNQFYNDQSLTLVDRDEASGYYVFATIYNGATAHLFTLSLYGN